MVPLGIVKTKVITDTSGASVHTWGLLTPYGLVLPLLDYCLEHLHDRSLRWKYEVVRSVRTFLAYLNANPHEKDPRALFRNFGQRLYTGTFDDDGNDSSGLCWTPKPRYAPGILSALTDFFDWLEEKREGPRLIPKYSGTKFDRMMDEAAYQHVRERAFLGHTWPTEGNRGTGHASRRIYLGARSLALLRENPPAFPENRFRDLLVDGFRVGSRYDHRGILITLALHGAGFRESEPFHLYVSDVMQDPLNSAAAMVLIHHPSLGAAPADWTDSLGRQRRGSRAEYLQARWGLKPRNEVLGAKHAGWKGGLHEAAHGSRYFRAFWFEPEYGELFLKVWHRYLYELIHVPREHPYAFANMRREPLGDMYTIAQYDKAHQRAVERIGLVAAKHYGTTTHGHRHAYGRRLKAAGIDKEFRRRFMHHASIESQEVYTQSTMEEMRTTISNGLHRLSENKLRSSATLDGMEALYEQ